MVMKHCEWKRFAGLVIATTVALLLCSSLAPGAQFKVTRVTDGDTIRVIGQGNELVIRLVGIDAPEISHKKREPSQPFGKAATKYLAGLALNKTVEIKEYGQDRYGRTLCVVLLSGKNVNLEMVKDGYAEVYRGPPAPGFDNSPYWHAEEQAKAAKRGMWSLGEKYVSPKEWRKTHQ